jgi:hypothetical protein
MVSVKHKAEKQDFSNIDIDILDIVSNASIGALINSPQLDSQFASDSNGLLGNTLSSRAALSAPQSEWPESFSWPRMTAC